MDPTSLPAGLRNLLVVAAAVLAIAGVGGLVTGAADGDELTAAGGTTDTTLGVTETTLGGDGSPSATAVPGAPGTTTAAGSAATTKPGGGSGPATTVAAAQTNACNAPDSSTNPGPIQPPALGVYSFVSCEDGSLVDDETIRAGNSSDGKVRREISHNQQGVQLTETVAYSAQGVIQEMLNVSAFGQQARCDWNPDIVEYPANLAVGTTWSVKSQCTTTFGPFKVDGTGKVLGRKAVTIAGTAVNTWVVETKVKLETPQGNQEAEELDYFDPARGIDLYRKTVASDGEGGKVTIVRRLASLTPKPL